jgi:cyclic dehypoxanthinyl futalosine synthase
MHNEIIYRKALESAPISAEEALDLYEHTPTEELMFVANTIRHQKNPGNEVGWMIDRNVNITNVCFSQCSFCNFCRKKESDDAYITSIDDYIKKINELYSLGGDQLLLQGGMNPELGIDFYTDLFRKLKSLYPSLKLHALGPPEVVYLAKK